MWTEPLARGRQCSLGLGLGAEPGHSVNSHKWRTNTEGPSRISSADHLLCLCP